MKKVTPDIQKEPRETGVGAATTILGLTINRDFN